MKKKLFKPSLFFLITFLLFACDEGQDLKAIHNKLVYCDAEKTQTQNGNVNFINNGYSFKSGENQTSIKAHSGKFSCKADSKNPYAMTIKMKDFPKDSYVEVSVWKFAEEITDGALVVSSEKGKKLYRKEHYHLMEEKSGWVKISLNILIPQHIESLVIYGHNSLDRPVYFDDLSIRFYKNKPVLFSKKNALNITISPTDYQKLVNNRAVALKQGIIDKSLKKYISASISHNGKHIPVKMRFKGDWTDHLEGHKWSFRIKTQKGHAFKGMRTFSIQSPHTRTFLNEWIVHKYFEHQDVLTTRYSFIPVYINGKELGVYAIEEHFDKQLLEAKNKREGPILKFDEEGVWEMAIKVGGDGWSTVPYYDAAAILPFKKKRTSKSPLLKSQFIIGQNLLIDYKTHKDNLKNVFDVENMAKYYAIIDLFGAYHSMAWHNQRFYVNPITCKIEPIGFDFSILQMPRSNKVDIIRLANFDKNPVPFVDYLNYNLIQQPVFTSRYLHYLKTFSNQKNISTFLKKINPELQELNSMLAKEYPGYHYNSKMILDYTSSLYKKAGDLIKKNNKSLLPTIKIAKRELSNFDKKNVYLNETGLKAYIKQFNDGISTINVTNYHLCQLSIKAYAIEQNKDSIIYLKTPIKLSSFSLNGKDTKDIKLPGKIKSLFFTAQNTGTTLLKKKVVSWAPPISHNPRLEIENKHSVKNSVFYKVKDSVIIFSGKTVINKHIYIPSGFSVIFSAGSSIYLKNNCGIISNSPIYIKGTKDNPVFISGEPKCQGIHVLQANKQSTLNYVTFSGLNTLKYKGWQLTGAVTFYESDVNINNCVFEKNLCEDALNVIRSTFNIKNCVFKETFADGLDGDFCSGEINNCTFKKTNNDCIDFSGSKVQITNCHIYDAGDKAVSGGEKSTIHINNLKVNKANIGVASKDKSVVEIKKSVINDVNIAYAAFQKKAEYGPAQIIVLNCTEKNLKKKSLIDKGSLLKYNAEAIFGKEKIDIEKLYFP